MSASRESICLWLCFCAHVGAREVMEKGIFIDDMVNISPAYLYCINVLIRVVGTVFLSFGLFKSQNKDELVLTLALAFFGAMMFWWGIFVLNKFIYASIDIKRGVLMYGNAFFQREIELSNVYHIGHYLYFSKILKVKIDSKVYYIHCLEDGIEHNFRTVKRS